jgi:type IV fimbrial biogenesis protein FimT
MKDHSGTLFNRRSGKKRSPMGTKGEIDRQSGFSLFELMVVIAILAVLAAIAVPNMISYRNRAKLGDGTRSLYSAFQAAKARAARNNANVTLSFAPAGVLDKNYALFIDDGAGTPITDGVPDGANNGVVDGTETVFLSEQIPVGVTISASSFTNDAVTFRGNGLPNGTGSLTVANARGEQRQISLSSAGRVRIQY